MTINRRSGPREHVPSFNENNRQTGARKLEARPESTAQTSGGRLERDHVEDVRKAAAQASHLMEPINEVQGKTHTADGRNPPNQTMPELDPNARYGADSPVPPGGKGVGGGGG
jgi:hypothetical protein